MLISCSYARRSSSNLSRNLRVSIPPCKVSAPSSSASATSTVANRDPSLGALARRPLSLPLSLTRTHAHSETLHPILQSRVGPDQFVSRILRLREDPRFRSVGPGVLEMIEDEEGLEELGEEDGLWFDFAFVEFLKTNYSECSLGAEVKGHSLTARLGAQSRSNERSYSIPTRPTRVVSPLRSCEATFSDPRPLPPPPGRSVDASGSPEVVNALRSSLASQSQELEEMREQVLALQQQREEEVRVPDRSFGERG